MYLRAELNVRYVRPSTVFSISAVTPARVLGKIFPTPTLLACPTSTKQHGCVASGGSSGSNHAVQFYRRENIDHTVYPMRGQLLRHLQGLRSKLYADKYGLKVVNLCIANVAVEPIDKHRLTTRISPRDLAQLYGISPDQEILKCDRQP